jgi:hypothetical protein
MNFAALILLFQVTLYTWVRLFKKDTEHTIIINKDGHMIAEYYEELVSAGTASLNKLFLSRGHD